MVQCTGCTEPHAAVLGQDCKATANLPAPPKKPTGFGAHARSAAVRWIMQAASLPARPFQRIYTHVYCRVLPAQEASVRGQLHMNTFRRLNLALVLQTGTTLVVAAQAVSLRNPLLTGASLESKRQNFPYCVPDCTAWYFRG
jgi:hypothetical protein